MLKGACLLNRVIMVIVFIYCRMSVYGRVTDVIVMMRTFAMPTWLTAASVKEPIWIQDWLEDMVGQKNLSPQNAHYFTTFYSKIIQ